MEGVIERAIFKNGKDMVEAKHSTLWSYAAKSIEGQMIDPLGPSVEGKKCVMVVNVATK